MFFSSFEQFYLFLQNFKKSLCCHFCFVHHLSHFTAVHVFATNCNWLFCFVFVLDTYFVIILYPLYFRPFCWETKNCFQFCCFLHIHIRYLFVRMYLHYKYIYAYMYIHMYIMYFYFTLWRYCSIFSRKGKIVQKFKILLLCVWRIIYLFTLYMYVLM